MGAAGVFLSSTGRHQSTEITVCQAAQIQVDVSDRLVVTTNTPVQYLYYCQHH